MSHKIYRSISKLKYKIYTSNNTINGLLIISLAVIKKKKKTQQINY